MAVTLSAIAPEVRWIIKDAPLPLIEALLRLAAIDFCRRSNFWQHALTPVAVTAASFPYTIPAPAGSAVARVLSVAFSGGKPLDPSDIATEEAENESWLTDKGVPVRFVERPGGILNVVPLPVESSDLKITVSLEPSQAAVDLPDLLCAKYREELKAGAVSRLCVLPGQRWTSGETAMFYGGIFETAIHDASLDFLFHRKLQTLETKPSDL